MGIWTKGVLLETYNLGGNVKCKNGSAYQVQMEHVLGQRIKIIEPLFCVSCIYISGFTEASQWGSLESSIIPNFADKNTEAQES